MKLKLRSTVKYALALLIGGGMVFGGFFLYERFLKPPPPTPEAFASPSERLAQLDSFGKEKLPITTRNSIAALGRLEPESGLIDLGGPMGDRVAELLVKEGDEVNAGQQLAKLQSYKALKAERDAIASKLEEAEARLKEETAYAQAVIKEAEIGLQEAKKLGPLEIKLQEARVRMLQKELKTAETDLARLEGITTPGTIPKQKLDHQRQLVQSMQEKLISAEVALDKAKAAHDLNLDKAKAKLHSAQINLARTKKAVPIDSLKKQVAAADAALERAVITAPHKGRILRILMRKGEPIGHQPILKMGDTEVMYVVAEVYETDVRLVQKGQRATITSPALGQALQGTVMETGLMIFKNDILHIDPAADADARVVEVRIRIDPESLEQVSWARNFTNLQVDVRIQIAPGNTISAKR